MNLQDLLDISDNPTLVESVMVTEDCSKENLEKVEKQLSNKLGYRLSLLKASYKEFYNMPDFCIEIEKIGEDLDKLFNKSFAVYDKQYNFKGIVEQQPNDEEDILLKRNAYSVFMLLVYGFNKTEIMDLLKVSRSYISLIMSTLRTHCQPLLDYGMDIDDSVPKYIKY